MGPDKARDVHVPYIQRVLFNHQATVSLCFPSRLKMSSHCAATSPGWNVFDKVAQAHVVFPTQSDAMLANLLLSHKVPYTSMNLILKIIKHPGFDSKEVTFDSAFEIFQFAEKSRVEDRRTVVRRRSVGGDTRMMQTRFPQVILFEVLNVLEQEREFFAFSRVGTISELCLSSNLV